MRDAWPEGLIGWYGRGGGALLDAGFELLTRSCRVEVEEGALPGPGQGHVVCAWHGEALLCFVALLQRDVKLVALCHPTWPLRPWMELARRRGGRAVPGSTGHGGREASREVVAALREGYSTVVFPDGPAGPPGEVRFGALHMAAQAGVPLVPLRFAVDRRVDLPRWDRLRLPLPGATLRVRVLPALRPTEATSREDARRLAAALGPTHYGASHRRSPGAHPGPIRSTR